LTGRARTLAALSVGVLALAGCGGGTHFANTGRPASPINVSVFVNDQRISVSPGSITPGLVTITIANQSSNARAIQIAPPGGSSAVTTTGPISPQATDQVTIQLSSGDYMVGITPDNSTQAAAATPSGVAAASLTVKGHRPNSNSQLLQP
jgi:hypothetical protein